MAPASPLPPTPMSTPASASTLPRAPTGPSATAGDLSSWKKFSRTAEFWLRATEVYVGYKRTQAEAAFKEQVLGWSSERVESEVWSPQHEWACEKMYSICVDMRGFYLKGGQFLGARSDFIPLPICKRLALLQDQVPPMGREEAKAAIERELGVGVDAVFDWIDLDAPLGSASISQVHKAKLRLPGGGTEREKGGNVFRRVFSWVTRYDPEQARRAAAYTASHSSAAGRDIAAIVDTLQYQPAGGERFEKKRGAKAEAREEGVGMVHDLGEIAKYAPEDGIVAVKIQYPNSLPTMAMDLENIRVWADFLSKTEIKFDMVSAVDELAKQVGRWWLSVVGCRSRVLAFSRSLAVARSLTHSPFLLSSDLGRSSWSLTLVGRPAS